MAQEATNLPGYTGTVLVHERPVEHGGLPVGLARHEQEPRARGGVGHRDLSARTSMDT
jgi:hypothetical protein